VAGLLANTFGRSRAETIAVTEVTRAAAEGGRLYQQQLQQAGFTFDRIWRTSNDERVCPVCGPLDGKPEAEWGGLDSPPAHPNCRCSVTLRRRRDPS
jgi:SPP1 gp7 family putative phage head morphogenesis protein